MSSGPVIPGETPGTTPPILPGDPGIGGSGGALNAPLPNIPQPIPQQGGMPLIARYIMDMVHPQRTSIAGGPPQSRGDMTLNFMGEFLANMANGLANAGHGPGANLRGFAGGVQAPYERSLQQYQMGQQQQMQQSQIAEQQSRAQLQQAQAEQMKNVVQTPYGPMSQALAAKLFPSMIGAAAKEDIAGKQIASREKLTGTEQGIQQSKIQQQLGEFHQTQAYNKWKTQFDNDTKLKVAQITAGKAPATLMQTAVFANGGLQTLNDAMSIMDDLEQKGVLGQSWAKNKAEDWIFGKGAVDPSLDSQTREEIGRLRQSVDLTASAVQRAHTGRGMKEMYDAQKKMLGADQDWSALRGAMGETKDLLTHYAGVASDANIQQLRSGGPPANAPKPSGPLSLQEAQVYLQKAGGNKDVARKMAKADGRTF
jgi:hypothetical protein